MLRVLLVRHAESLLNKKREFQGADRDSPLSSEGVFQVQKLADHLKGLAPKKIYSSDLGRARETAERLAQVLHIPVENVAALRELKIGDWAQEGGNFLERWASYYKKEIERGIPREEIRPPHGENSWDHAKRVASFLEEIKGLEGTIIVVAHAGTNKVLLGVAQGLDPDEYYTIQQNNACVNELVYDGTSWKILRVNDTSHLK